MYFIQSGQYQLVILIGKWNNCGVGNTVFRRQMAHGQLIGIFPKFGGGLLDDH